MKYVKNNSLEQKNWLGKIVEPDEYYLIPASSEIYWSNDSVFLIDVANGVAVIAKTDDGTSDIIPINEAINYLKNNVAQLTASQPYPFAQKTLPSGERLFKRIHGISAVVSGAPDNINFTIPYTKCKINGIEIINCELGDKASFKVLDTSSGTISGVPNYMLNQFGFDVCMPKDYYREESNYDADLIQGMVLRIEYDAINSDLLPKTIYINFLMHEVVD